MEEGEGKDFIRIREWGHDMDEKDTTTVSGDMWGTLSPTLLWRREIHQLTDGQQSPPLDISMFSDGTPVYIPELPEESDEDLQNGGVSHASATVYVSVKYNGKDITKKNNRLYRRLRVCGQRERYGRHCFLKLNNRSGVWWGGWIPIQGDYVEATIKTTNWNKEGDNRSLNCGYFLIDDLGYSGPPQIATIGA